MAPDQLALRYDGATLSEAAWQELLAVLREVVDDVSLKEASYALGVSAPLLAHALAERDRHYMRGEWIIGLVALDKQGRIARVFADAAGKDLIDKKPLEPAEELARIKAAMERCLGPELRAALLNEAKREPRQ